MPTFKYQSLTSSGQARSGVLSAVDRADVVRQLMGRGETATHVEAEDGGPPSASTKRRPVARKKASAAPATTTRRRRGRPVLSQAETANLIRELATALEAGLPLMQGLKTVRKQASGRAMPVILDHLIERVEAGDPLHAAARDYGPPFDDMILGMLRAADASGEMSHVLHQLADLLERSLELKREVAGATMYPALLSVFILISIVLLVTVLVPRLIEPLAGNITLPWPTEVLIGLADFFSSYWLIVLLGGAAVWFGWRTWSSIPDNKQLFDGAVLRVPVLGTLLRDVAVARFTRTLGTLTASGLPLLEALRITKHTLVNRAMMAALDAVEEQVTAGKALADPLERSGLFPPLLVQVVNLGERSGKLEAMLLHSATAFDRRVNTSIKLFTKALPPVLLLFMALVGGFVLAAVLLPLLELQSMIG